MNTTYKIVQDPVIGSNPWTSPQRSHEAVKKFREAKECFKKAWKGDEGSTYSQGAQKLGQATWKAFDDSDFMMVGFEVEYAAPARGTRWIGWVLRVSEAAGKVIENLGIVLGFISIFYLYHTVRDASKNFKKAWKAIKYGRKLDCVFFIFAGSSRTTFAGGIGAKPIKQGFTWAGLGAQHTVKFIFSYATPVAFLCGSTMSGIRKTWEMVRTINAYRNFKGRVATWKKNKDLAGLFETLESQLNVPDADSYDLTDEKANFIFTECIRKKFVDSRYTSGKRYTRLKDDMQALEVYTASVMAQGIERLDEGIAALDPIHKNSDLLKDVIDLRQKFQKLSDNLWNSSDIAISEHVEIYEKLAVCYDELKAQNLDSDQIEKLYGALETNRVQFYNLRAEIMAHGEYVQDRITSEMHRRFLYNTLNLTMSCLMIVGNIFIILNCPHVLVWPNGLVTGTLFWGTVLTFSSAMVDIPYLIFNKSDDERGFRWIERKLSKVTPLRTQMKAPKPLRALVQAAAHAPA